MLSTDNEVDGQLVEGIGKTPNSNRTFSVPQAVLDELRRTHVVPGPPEIAPSQAAGDPLCP